MLESQARGLGRWRSATLLWVALLASAMVGLSLLGPTSAFAITRDTVLTRAQTWVDAAVPYSQKKHYHGYRTDCSGFVSMCWQTAKPGWDTATFHHVTHTIAVSALKPGDAMLKRGYHIMLFVGWVDPAHTQYVVREQTGPAKADIRSIASDIGFGYKPTRYNKIVGSPPSRNVMLNPSFDTWDYYRGLPVWWASGWRTDLVHRTDVSHAGRSSLELDSASSYRGDRGTQLAQTVAVSENQTYTLSAWVMTGDAASVSLSLQCLDASGAVLAAPSTAGGAWALDASTFKRMTLTAVMPEGTTQATVLVQLLGGSGYASDSVGTSATVDDISLTAPAPVPTTTRLSAPASAKVGATLKVTGAVSSPAASGTVTLVETRRVGTKWEAVRSVKVPVAAGTFSCTFKPTVKGDWQLVARYPAGAVGTTAYGSSNSAVKRVNVK
jgi:hypothetical protein